MFGDIISFALSFSALLASLIGKGNFIVINLFDSPHLIK